MSEKRDAVLSRLVDLIVSTVMFASSVTIAKSDYEALDSAAKRNLSDNPYAICSIRCLIAIAQWLKGQGLNEKVAYVFKAGDPGGREFQDGLSRIMASARVREDLRILSSTMAEKKSFPALDNADFFAWEVAHHLPKRLQSSSIPARPMLQKISDTIPIQALCFDKRTLEMMGERFTPEYSDALSREAGVRLRRGNPKRPYKW